MGVGDRSELTKLATALSALGNQPNADKVWNVLKDIDLRAAAAQALADANDGTVTASGGTLGFYGATPVAQQTGVAVTVGAVHAALVNLGLITA